MPDPVDALTQVEDLLAACLRAWPALADRSILTDQSKDIAPDQDERECINIWCIGTPFQVAAEQWNTRWLALFEIEVASDNQRFNTINRANRLALAQVIMAFAQDRTLGGQVKDIQEIDLGSVMPAGKDLSQASLQVRVEFETPRDNPFLLLS